MCPLLLKVMEAPETSLVEEGCSRFMEERLKGYLHQRNRFLIPEDQWSCKRSPDYFPGITTTVKQENLLDAQEQLTLWSLIRFD